MSKSNCDVCLEFDGAASVDFFTKTTQCARKPYRCAECGETISPGVRYVRASGRCEGAFWSARVCAPCNEILTVFSCGGYQEYGNLWVTMTEVVLPELRMTHPCLRRLSATAFKKLMAAWWAWRAETELTHESEPRKEN